MTNGKWGCGPGGSARYLTFDLMDHEYGIPLGVVREIRAVPGLYPDGESVPYVKGMIQIRGDFVTTIDLRTMLGLAGFSPRPDASVLVTRYDDARVGLLVDRAGEMVTIADGRLTPPAPGPGVDPDLVLGTLERPEGPLLLLDGPALIRRASGTAQGSSEGRARPKIYERARARVQGV